MIIGYSDYTLAFAISGSQSPAPVFLTDSGAMDDARCGLVTSIQFTGGVQSTSVYAAIAVTVSTVMDAGAPFWGIVGVCNVTGLPQGTKLVCNGVTQRLAPNARGELEAWWVFGATFGGTVNNIYIYNDVNGVASLTAGQVFGIGEIFIGRAIQLPTLLDQQMADDLNDISAYNRSNNQQLYSAMRKPWRQYSQVLGRFTVAQARGKGASNLANGAGGTIDLQTLRAYLAVQRKCAVCDIPSQGFGAGSALNGLQHIDTTLMQANWMIAKQTSPGRIYLDSAPYYSWNPVFQEAL